MLDGAPGHTWANPLSHQRRARVARCGTRGGVAVSSVDTFGSKGTLSVSGKDYEIFRLSAVEGLGRLPYSLKVLAENLLRTEDGANTTADHIRALAAWDPQAEPSTEIQFTPARVVMQDFTGVPCVVDLATMREAVADLGGDRTASTRWPRPSSSSTTRCRSTSSAAATRSRGTWRSSTSATTSATSSCAGGRRRSTTSRWCPRAPASCTRSTSSTWRAP